MQCLESTSLRAHLDASLCRPRDALPRGKHTFQVCPRTNWTELGPVVLDVEESLLVNPWYAFGTSLRRPRDEKALNSGRSVAAILSRWLSLIVLLHISSQTKSGEGAVHLVALCLQFQVRVSRKRGSTSSMQASPYIILGDAAIRDAQFSTNSIHIGSSTEIQAAGRFLRLWDPDVWAQRHPKQKKQGLAGLRRFPQRRSGALLGTIRTG